MIFISTYSIGQIAIKSQLLLTHLSIFGLAALLKSQNCTKPLKSMIISVLYPFVMEIESLLVILMGKLDYSILPKEKKSIAFKVTMEELVV